MISPINYSPVMNSFDNHITWKHCLKRVCKKQRGTLFRAREESAQLFPSLKKPPAEKLISPSLFISSLLHYCCRSHFNHTQTQTHTHTDARSLAWPLRVRVVMLVVINIYGAWYFNDYFLCLWCWFCGAERLSLSTFQYNEASLLKPTNCFYHAIV